MALHAGVAAVVIASAAMLKECKPSEAMLCCSSGSWGGSEDMYFGFYSLPLDLPYGVGHVLAQHLPLGHHHNLASGYPASQKRQEGCQGRTAVGVVLFYTAQADLYTRLVPGSN